MERPLTRHTHQRAVLAEIQRREWLLQMLALAAAGCRRDRGQASEPTITVFYSLGMQDGMQENISLDGSAQFLVFLPLVVWNAKGEVEGRLARSWEHSADYRTWTIHLRTDVLWQDGVPVTARDIKFTIDLMSRPDVLELTPGVFSVTVLDDHTYTITYLLDTVAAGNAVRGGEGPMIAGGEPPWVADVFYPKHLLEHLDPKGFRTWDFWNHPVGNGPYRLVRRVPMTMTEYEANPTYYRGRPRIRRVVLKGLTSESALTELLSGHVQEIWLDPKDVPKLGNDPRFRVYYGIKPTFLFAIAWHHRHPLFRQALVRRALTLAINRRELLRVLNLSEEIPVQDVISSQGQFRRGELPEPLPYDPAQAKRLLETAGWRDPGEGRVREREGKPFRFTLLTSDAASAVYVQAQLREVGIQMDVETMDRSVVNARFKAGNFEAVIARLHTTPGGALEWFGDRSPFGSSDPRVTGLLTRAWRTLDPDEIDRIYRELMPIFQAEVPVTFLFPRVEVTVATRQVHGLSSPYRTDPVTEMEDLWLDE